MSALPHLPGLPPEAVERLGGGALRSQYSPDQLDRYGDDLDRDRAFWDLTSLPEAFFCSTWDPHEVIQALADRLQMRRSVLLAVLHHPPALLQHLAATQTDSGWRTCHVWVRLCWTAEAAWRCVSAESDVSPGRLAATDRRLLLPLAARLRFLVLTEPLRYRTRPSPFTPPDGEDEDEGLVRTFGVDSWHDFVARARDARWQWQALLDSYQDHPLLARATAAGLEEEVDALVFDTGDRRRRYPLVISTAPLDRAAALGPDEEAVIGAATERHLLPRFRLVAVARLALPAPGRADGCYRRWAGAAVLVPLVGVAVTLALQHDVLAALFACACYATIGIGVAWQGQRWAAPWLLRLPAASSVGLLALLALSSSWWKVHSIPRGMPVAVLAAVSAGYLLIQCRAHGVAPRAALMRTAVVFVVGTVHALLVSLIGLVLVASGYVDRGDGRGLDTAWRSAAAGGWPAGDRWQLLALATAWCLAVGVFSQILWEDRPVTAQLTFMRWTRER